MNTVWLFCTVIDNFGDIGVCWRLAKELRNRLNMKVILFLDDDAALTWLAPDFANEAHIHIKKWQENQWADLHNVPPATLVIETFACGLPETVKQKIKQNQSTWLNWEYLSAEHWAVRSHAMQSLQADGYPKFFWQMGFVAESGGLLREASVVQRLTAPSHFRQPETIFMFGYENDKWLPTLKTWQQIDLNMEIHLFGKQILQSLGKTDFSGSLKIISRPFVPQAEFDDLLAQYDLLFVRGEDSFVRAQFSGKPFFWHIYPQAKLAHLDKLDAFWDLAFGANPCAWQIAHRALSDELNGANTLPEKERIAHWQTLLQHWQDWQIWAQNWRNHLLEQSDTVSRLADWLNSKTP